MNPLRNERGAILIISLWVLLAMTLMGIIATKTAQMEILLAGNHKITTQAFYQAEGAINLGQVLANNIHTYERVNNSDYLLNPDTWSFTFDETGDIDIGLGPVPNMSFEVVVRMVVSETGSVKVFGDHDGNINTPSILFWSDDLFNEDPNNRPCYVITSTGWSPSFDHPRKATQVVGIEVWPIPSLSLPEAALQLNGDLENNGTPQSAIGEGHPDDGEDCGTKDIVGTNTTIGTYDGNTGDDRNIQTDAEAYPVDDLARALTALGDEFDSSPPYDFGSSDADEDNVYWYEGDLTPPPGDGKINNLDGYGILVVIGDLELAGNISWNGLIVVTGDLILSGGGTADNYIQGSVLVGGNVRGNGTPDIYYDCARLKRIVKKHKNYVRKWWKQL